MAEELTETERIALEEAGKRTVDKLRASAQKILGDPHRTEDDTRWMHTLTSVLDFFDGKSQAPMQDIIPVKAIEKVKGDALEQDRAAGTESPDDLRRREMELKGFKLLIIKSLLGYSEQMKSRLS